MWVSKQNSCVLSKMSPFPRRRDWRKDQRPIRDAPQSPDVGDAQRLVVIAMGANKC